MNAFNIAMNTLFDDPNLMEVAVYIPKQGATQKVSVITHKPDALTSVGETFVATTTLMLDVRVVDCPALLPGDKFLVGGIMHTVQGSPKLDDINVTWRVDLA